MAATSVAIGAAGAALQRGHAGAARGRAGFCVFGDRGDVARDDPRVCAGAAPTPSLAPLSIGWVVQGNYLGQVIGPLAIGSIVGAFGWSGGIGLMLAAAVTGAAIGLSLLRETTGRR